MPVKIGSARMDERGKATGGTAGDQTGKEVSTQDWYAQSTNTWVLIRPNDPEKAEKIAVCMEKACANSKIGYDQNQRLTLYNAVKPHGFSIDKLDKAVETDCSALVRVCCAFAGISIPDFTTPNQASKMIATGEFTKHTVEKYTKQSAYLRRGDVLVTKNQGHTVVVLSDGSKAYEGAGKPEGVIGENPYPKPTTIKQKGNKGQQVKWLQFELDQSGFDLGDYGVDGDFGKATDKATREFQAIHKLVVDGQVGPKTIKALVDETGLCPHAGEPAPEPTPQPPAPSPSDPMADLRHSRKMPDISYYDGAPNYAKVAAEQAHIWVREGDSLRKRDPEFERNVRECVKYGIRWSTYLFFRAGKEGDAITEIDTFVKRVKATGATPLSYVLDVEVDSITVAAVKAAVKRLRELVGNDVLIGIYVGHHLYTKFKSVINLFDYVWIPRYNSWKTPPAYPYHIWQGGFSEFAGIRGGAKSVDCNRPKTGLTWADVFQKRT
jgi:Putative peptidoglycan-binding domain-containing protein